MKRWLLTALLCLAAGSAAAQNAGEIARARGGASSARLPSGFHIPGCNIPACR